MKLVLADRTTGEGRGCRCRVRSPMTARLTRPRYASYSARNVLFDPDLAGCARIRRATKGHVRSCRAASPLHLSGMIGTVMDLTGRTVLLTGASRGIGAVLAI